MGSRSALLAWAINVSARSLLHTSGSLADWFCSASDLYCSRKEPTGSNGCMCLPQDCQLRSTVQQNGSCFELRALRRPSMTSRQPASWRLPASGQADRPASAPSDASRLARAKGYPYVRPESSFVFVNGQAHIFDDSAWKGICSLADVQLPSGTESCSVRQLVEQANMDAARLLAEDQVWTPVLAIGSNAGPEQLARKFPASLFPQGVLIPALRAVLPDFDVVYAPLVSSYGSATATLEYSPGTKVAVYVTFLTPDLLRRMDETEGAYDLCELFNIHLHVGVSLQDFGLGKPAPESLKEVFQYNHQNGTPHFALSLDGQASATSPISIQAIPALDRNFPGLSQIQMQQALMHLFQHREAAKFPPLPVASSGHDSACQADWEASSMHDLDAWILENLDNTSQRASLVDALTGIARPFGWKSSKIMRTLGDRYAANVA